VKIAQISTHNEAGHQFDVGSSSCFRTGRLEGGLLKTWALQLKAFLLLPEAFHVFPKTWKDTSSKGREQNPTHSRAEEPCVSLSHFLADSTLTSRDVKEFVFASVNHNNDHDMWSMSQSMLGLLKHANFHK